MSVLLGAISGGMALGKGVASYFARRQYAKDLEGMEKTMPASITKAEGIMAGLANSGMPGADVMKSGVDAQIASILGSGSRYMDSPQALTDALLKASNGGSAQKNQIDVSDANYRADKQGSFANFLSSVKAPMENNIQDFNINKKLSANRERMMGLADLLGGAETGASNFAQGFANKQYTSYLKSKRNYYKDLMKGGGVDDPVLDPANDPVLDPANDPVDSPMPGTYFNTVNYA